MFGVLGVYNFSWYAKSFVDHILKSVLPNMKPCVLPNISCIICWDWMLWIAQKKMKTSVTHDKGRLDYKSVKWNDKKLTRSTTFNHAKAFRPKAIYLWNTWSATMTCKIYLPRFPTFLLDHRSPLLHNGAKEFMKSLGVLRHFLGPTFHIGLELTLMNTGQ